MIIQLKIHNVTAATTTTTTTTTTATTTTATTTNDDDDDDDDNQKHNHNTNTNNPHLGLITGPPSFYVLARNDLFHYSFTIKKARHMFNVGQDFINTFCDTGDTSSVILGVILGIIHFLSKRDPQTSDQL